jgi:hypothetical protein
MQTDTAIRAKLAEWVEAKRGFAVGKADPDAFLMAWHDWLGDEMARLCEGDTPDHLVGLTGWELSEAQIALIRPLAGLERAAA